MDDIEITIDAGLSDGDLLTVELATGSGRLILMGLVELTGGRLVVRDMHIGGSGANSFGPRALRALAFAMLEKIDVDEIVIHGSSRTSGANPGRRPNVFRISRKDRAENEDSREG